MVQVLRKRADTVAPGQHEAYLRYMVFTLESACRAMQQGQEKWVWIMDMAGGGGERGPWAAGQVLVSGACVSGACLAACQCAVIMDMAGGGLAGVVCNACSVACRALWWQLVAAVLHRMVSCAG